jgi:aryl-alcohol dehydrogenase-like predicted oxidoreductase
MWAWQFATALRASDCGGHARFSSMQNLYNLLYREEEREMNPLCRSENVALIPWSPTAVGLLSGSLLKEGKLLYSGEKNPRNAPESPWSTRYPATPENVEIIRRVVDIAHEKAVTPIQISLAWLLHKGVTAPVFGTRSPEHLDEAVGAVDVRLTDKETGFLEEPYRPRQVVGMD